MKSLPSAAPATQAFTLQAKVGCAELGPLKRPSVRAISGGPTHLVLKNTADKRQSTHLALQAGSFAKIAHRAISLRSALQNVLRPD